MLHGHEKRGRIRRSGSGKELRLVGETVIRAATGEVPIEHHGVKHRADKCLGDTRDHPIVKGGGRGR